MSLPDAGASLEDPEERFRRVVEAIAGSRVTDGNRVEVLRNGVEIFPAMLEAVRSARRTIDFVTFVYWTGSIAEEMAAALSGRARQGARVRVLLDAVGAAPMSRDLVDEMARAGVDLRWFRPPVRWKLWEVDHRTHRKILVVDDTIGFTGGVGIAEEWEGDARDPSEWRDTHFRVEGPVVDGMRAAFLADWRETDRRLIFPEDQLKDPGQVGEVQAAVIDGSANVGWSIATRLLEGAITVARQRIRIGTPYLNPSAAVEELLIGVASSGVEVDILMPGPHIDKRVAQIVAEDRYAPLLDAGVRVWRYQPTMYHVKQVLVDDLFACVGSVNLNHRSFEKDEEVALCVLDGGVVALLDAQFQDDLARSERVQPGSWDGRSALQRAAELALRPLRGEV